MTANLQSFSEVMTEYEHQIRAKNLDKALHALTGKLNKSTMKPTILERLKKLTAELIELEEKEWNGIWARIIANFLSTSNLGRFSIIIGNPPMDRLEESARRL